MQTQEIFLYIIAPLLGFLAIIWIIYEVIFAASYGKKNWIELQKQNILLNEIVKGLKKEQETGAKDGQK